MVANALDLHRSHWENHPHYPGNVLLLGAHANFRRISEVLLQRAEAGGDAPGILTVFDWWKSAMRNHERYEEHKLYPYLAHRFGIDPESMCTGHDELAVEDQRVRAAVARDGLVFSAALRRHHEVLVEHLAHEEDVVIPALLALSREDFQAYCDHDLRWLKANHASREG